MTVAAVVENDGRFLVVEEHADGARVFNQPAGHLEPGERLVDAVIREVREEAGTGFTPEAVVGVYRWVNPANDETHVRVAFCGSVDALEPQSRLDEVIVTPHWLTRGELRDLGAALRSPMVLGCIDDYVAGQRFALELLRDLT